VYDDGVASGVAKYVRLTDVIYPNGRDVVYGYGSSGSTDDVLSRIQSIGDGTDNYSVYSYLGADSIVTEDYEEPEIKLDYSVSNFAALDRFGRVLDQAWSDYGTPGVVDEYTYTFDRVGNRTSRGNALESALSQIFDYDDLNQLISADRTNGYTQ
jgi:hypothetical protein